MLEFDGNKLKKLREKKKLRQVDLAMQVGKNTADISNYENGYATPPADVLLNLMAFFRVSQKSLSKLKEVETV